MNTYPYRTYAEIDLNKMQHNLRQVRAAIGPDCKLLFVLKADAYGHGTPVCAKYSEELVDWYAVATIDEALSIRRAGVEKPILLFGALQDPEIELAADQPHYHQFLFPGVQPPRGGGFAAVRQAHGLPH